MLLVSMLYATVLTLPVFFICLATNESKKNLMKQYDAAIKQGKKVVRAPGVLKRQHRAESPGSGKMTNLCIYEYTHNGKNYKYRMYSNSCPSTIGLSFFSDNPRGATTGVMPRSKGSGGYKPVVIVFICLTVSNYLSMIQ